MTTSRRPALLSGRRRRSIVAAAGLCAILAACSSTNGSGATSGAATTAATTRAGTTAASGQSTAAGPASSATGGDFLAEAQKLVEQGYQGTSREPAPGPAAVKGKKVFVIPCGVSSFACNTAAEGVKEAAKTLEWDVTVVDGKLAPAGYTAGIQQAISAKADAIITVGIDCTSAKSAYEQAKAAGIPTVGVYGIDCSDPRVGGQQTLTTVDMGFGQNAAKWYEEWGALRAAYLISKTNGQAKVLQIAQTSFLNIESIDIGFERELAKCTTCSVVKKQEISVADIVANQVPAKISAALLSSTDANAIAFDSDGNVVRAAAALRANPRPDWVIAGGEGLPGALPLVGKTITAVFAFPSDWLGWCAAYNANEVLAKHEITDCGIGFTIVDADHNQQAEGASQIKPTVDYQSIMKKQWTS